MFFVVKKLTRKNVIWKKLSLEKYIKNVNLKKVYIKKVIP